MEKQQYQIPNSVVWEMKMEYSALNTGGEGGGGDNFGGEDD